MKPGFQGGGGGGGHSHDDDDEGCCALKKVENAAAPIAAEYDPLYDSYDELSVKWKCFLQSTLPQLLPLRSLSSAPSVRSASTAPLGSPFLDVAMNFI
jgi:hypothetical protein